MLNGNNVIFSIETRRYYLMLMLFSKENAMSLNHFSIDLQVSKILVIHDINHVKEQLEDHGLSLKYSRNMVMKLLVMNLKFAVSSLS